MNEYEAEDARYRIERFIEQYDGTSIGQSVKNMLGNGTPIEYIADFLEKNNMIY